MLERSKSPELFARLLADPDIKPYALLPHQSAEELLPLLYDEKNYFLARKEGGFFFRQIESGVYEMHTLFTKEGRGKIALKAARFAFAWLFLQTDCMEIWTQVPHSNIRADYGARLVGFEEQFKRDKMWGEEELTFYQISYWKWARSSHRLAIGKDFHDDLEAKLQAKGFAQDHPKDLAHNLYVGICCEMVKAGQLAKGIILYNRWARIAQYPEIKVLSQVPTILDIGSDVWIWVENGKIEVLKCPSV